MNKREVNDLLPKAYEVIQKVGISNNDKIDNAYRGQISSFGAAIATGSLLPAVAFFSQKGSSSVDRHKLMKAIFKLIKSDETVTHNSLFNYVKAVGEREAKEKVINAAIALKLAMNLYVLDEKEAKENDAELSKQQEKQQ